MKTQKKSKKSDNELKLVKVMKGLYIEVPSSISDEQAIFDWEKRQEELKVSQINAKHYGQGIKQ